MPRIPAKSSLLSSHHRSTEQENRSNDEPLLDADAMLFSDPIRPATSPSTVGGLSSEARCRPRSLPHSGQSRRRNTLQTTTVARHHGYVGSQRTATTTRGCTTSLLRQRDQRDQSPAMTDIMNSLEDLDQSRILGRPESASWGQPSASSARSSVVTQIHVPTRTSESPIAVTRKKQNHSATAKLSLDVPRASVKRKEHSPPSTSSAASRSVFSHPITPGTSLSSQSKSVRRNKQVAPVLPEEVYFGSSEGSDADSEPSSVSSLSDVSDFESSIGKNYEVSEDELDEPDFSPRLSTSRPRKSSPKNKSRRARSYSPPSSNRGYSSDDACPPPIARVRIERLPQHGWMPPESRTSSFKQRTLLLSPHVTIPRQASPPPVHESTHSRPRSARRSQSSQQNPSGATTLAPMAKENSLANQRWSSWSLEDRQPPAEADCVTTLNARSDAEPASLNSRFNASSKKNSGSVSLRKSSFLARFSLASSSTPKAPSSSLSSKSNRRPAASRHMNAAQEFTLSTLAQHALISVDQPPTPPPKDAPPPAGVSQRPLTPKKQLTPEQVVDVMSPRRNPPPSSPIYRHLTLQEAIDSVSPPTRDEPVQVTTISAPSKSIRSVATTSVMEAPSVPRVSYPRTSVPNRNKTKRKTAVDAEPGVVPLLSRRTASTNSGQATSPSKREKWLQPLEAWRLKIGKGVNRKERKEAQRLEEMCRRELVGS